MYFASDRACCLSFLWRLTIALILSCISFVGELLLSLSINEEFNATTFTLTVLETFFFLLACFAWELIVGTAILTGDRSKINGSSLNSLLNNKCNPLIQSPLFFNVKEDTCLLFLYNFYAFLYFKALYIVYSMYIQVILNAIEEARKVKAILKIDAALVAFVNTAKKLIKVRFIEGK